MSLKQHVICNIEKNMLNEIKKENMDVINFMFGIEMDFTYFKVSEYKVTSSLEFLFEKKIHEITLNIFHNSKELEIIIMYNNFEIFKLNETSEFCSIDRPINMFFCYMERIKNKPKNSYTIEDTLDNHISCLGNFDLIMKYTKLLQKYTSLSIETYCKQC